MIKLKEKLKIIELHLSSKSNREISRILGIDKKTVNKYVKEFKVANKALASPDELTEEEVRDIAETITATPKYAKRKSPPRKWNAQMDEFLDQILADDDKKCELLHTKKQSLRNNQILQLMHDEGFDIGYTTLCKKIKLKRNKTPEVFIAQQYRFGQRFEYDFGEVHLIIAGQHRRCYIAVMCAPASNYRFARIYLTQKFDVFVDSQVRFFEHVGGCFEEGVYDNMRNVVKKFIGKNEKELNDGLVKLSLYYGFKINVTNCFSGNEKGSVERSVEIVRNAAFSKNWVFDSLEDAQAHLDSALVELNASCAIDEERAALSPHKPPYEIADMRDECNVNKYCCVRYDNASYSVPDCFMGKKLCIKAYPTEIVIQHKGEVIARHVRSHVAGDMVLDINHYLHTLKRKPGALANSCALAANLELKEIFEREYKDNPREFISILSESSRFGFDAVLTALKAHQPFKASTKECAPQTTPQTTTTTQTNLGDHIAKQTQEQIALIGAIGCGVA